MLRGASRVYMAECRNYGVLWGSTVGVWGRAQEPWGAVGHCCAFMGQGVGSMGCWGPVLWIYGAEQKSYGVLWGSTVGLWDRVLA